MYNYCAVESNLKLFLLSFSVPPSVRAVPSSGQITARKGGAVTLECKASGNPVPQVSWVNISSGILLQLVWLIYFSWSSSCRWKRVEQANQHHVLAKDRSWLWSVWSDNSRVFINAQLITMSASQLLLICDWMCYVSCTEIRTKLQIIFRKPQKPQFIIIIVMCSMYVQTTSHANNIWFSISVAFTQNPSCTRHTHTYIFAIIAEYVCNRRNQFCKIILWIEK